MLKLLIQIIFLIPVSGRNGRFRPNFDLQEQLRYEEQMIDQIVRRKLVDIYSLFLNSIDI